MNLNGSPCEPFSHVNPKNTVVGLQEKPFASQRTQKRVVAQGANRLRKNSRIALVGSSREPSFGQTVSKEAHMALRISQSATETL